MAMPLDARRVVSLFAALCLLAAVFAVAPAQPAAAAARALTLVCPPGEAPPASFTDTSGTTHHESITCVAWYEIAQGVTSERYEPGRDVTRGQMASFVAATAAHLGIPLPASPRDAYPDDNGIVHEANINALAELGIVTGYPDGRYRPHRPVARDQMASFLARVLREAGIADAAASDAFDDDQGNVHEPSINAVAAVGIAAGVRGRRYDPSGLVLRGAMASFLARTVDYGIERDRAYEGAAAVSLDETEANPGDTVQGRLRTHQQVVELTASGCGLSGPVQVDADGRFSVTIPASQQPGTCEISFQVRTTRVHEIRDTDRVTVSVGQGSKPPVVTIEQPTTGSPAVAQENAKFTLAFRTDRPGDYVVAHRRQGAQAFTNFADQAATGSAATGPTTLTLTAPGQDGNYDLQVTLVTRDEKRGADTETNSLRVTDPPGPQPANVSITEPTGSPPEITTQGSAFDLTFASDLPGTYSVQYRPSFPGGSAPFVPFPDTAARGSLPAAGEKTVGLTAPATPGSYDLRVEFTTTAAKVSAATATSALFVTAPGLTDAQRCDPIDPSLCMFPFPNDHFTAADPLSATGRRINFNVLSMPRNGGDQQGTGNPSGGAGKPVDPTEWNRNDGFSPGNHVMTFVPGLDLVRTWGTAAEAHAGDPSTSDTYFDYRDHIADIDRYKRADAPIVIIDAATGQRHPFWSELDQNTSGPGGSPVPASGLLMLRPAVNFLEGHRYIVALRGMRESDGDVIEPAPAFRAYRDGTAALTDPRRARFEDIFGRLVDAGVERDNLYLAWDFTIASERNLAERMLHIRDDAFAMLGDTNLADGIVAGTAPEFVIDDVIEGDDQQSSGAEMGPYREISGRITVPNYLDRPQEAFEVLSPLEEGGFPELPVNPAPPGSRFYYGPDVPGAPLTKDALPQQNPTQPELEAKFLCRVPLGRSQPVMLGLYGHGLLGTRSQVGDIRSPGNHDFGGCGLDWIGMATEDAPTVAAILGDISNFPALPDRSQQGFLNFLYAGRAMVHPDGFAADEAFQDEDGKPLIRVATPTQTPLYYDGNSQGGILGAGLMAVSVDATRGILGVPGNNYSTLLNRSVDWEPVYGLAYYTTYQNKLEQQLGFALLQMLWDRSEGNGYAQHMTTDPLANTPAHEVLLQVAWSDHQVSNHAAEVTARTYGAPVMTPNLQPRPANHHWEKAWPNSLFSGTATYPHQGSALVYWDSGNTTPPNGNLPPEHNGDPHGHPRDELASSWQEAHFILTGQLVDVCAGGPYLTDNHPANDGKVSCVPPTRPPGT